MFFHVINIGYGENALLREYPVVEPCERANHRNVGLREAKIRGLCVVLGPTRVVEGKNFHVFTAVASFLHFAIGEVRSDVG